MKKIICLIVLIFCVNCCNEMFATICNPCSTNWNNESTVTFSYGACLGVKIYWQTQSCDDKCYFRVIMVEWPPSCGTPPDMGALMYAAQLYLINNNSFFDDCKPEEGCENSVESKQDVCWKWQYVSPGGNDIWQLIPCAQISCCETVWRVCAGRDPFILSQQVTDLCEDPEIGCSNNCPEIP